jgi:hypothetical protein
VPCPSLLGAGSTSNPAAGCGSPGPTNVCLRGKPRGLNHSGPALPRTLLPSPDCSFLHSDARHEMIRPSEPQAGDSSPVPPRRVLLGTLPVPLRLPRVPPAPELLSGGAAALVRFMTGPVVALAVAFLIWTIATRKAEVQTGPSVEFSPVVSLSIGIAVDRAKLYVSWALALVAAIGFFFKTLIDGDIRLFRRELILLECSVVASIVSIVFGEIVISNILSLLAVKQFDIENPLIQSYSTLQYWTLLGGFTFGVAFIHDFFWRWHREKLVVHTAPDESGGGVAGADGRAAVPASAEDARCPS